MAMTNKVMEFFINAQRDLFVRAIKEGDVCRLASSYHNNDPCHFFKPPKTGSYNVCYFVEFRRPSNTGTSSEKTSDEETSNAETTDQKTGDRRAGTEQTSSPADGRRGGEGGHRWVVRVPINPCLRIPAHEKVQSEVAVMQYVSRETTIPMPAVLFYSLAKEKFPGWCVEERPPYGIASFIILEYIEGTMLNEVDIDNLEEDKRRILYAELADYFIQLRRLQFPAIGRLGPSRSDPQKIEVTKGTMTNCINLQERENIRARSVMKRYEKDGSGVLTSAEDYVSMLLAVAHNAFRSGRATVRDYDEGWEFAYHYDLFREYTRTLFVNTAVDAGPFVLVHGDFAMHNIVVDEDLRIRAVLDWEWARVVPVQLFQPPLWLTGKPFSSLVYKHHYENYVRELDVFRTVVREREKARYGNELLTREWAGTHQAGGVLCASALESWDLIDHFAGEFLEEFYFGHVDLVGRVEGFKKENPDYGPLIESKLDIYEEYRSQRKVMGLDSTSDTEDDGNVEEEEEDERGPDRKRQKMDDRAPVTARNRTITAPDVDTGTDSLWRASMPLAFSSHFL